MTPPPLLPDERSDSALIAAHLAGDTTAFGEVFRRHRDRVWAITLRTLGNPSDAADVTQDTFLKAMRSAGSFRGDSAVTTWLHRIAVNACLDHLRAGTRRPADALGDSDPTARVAGGGQHDAFSTRDTEIVVREALAQLSEDQRLAVMLVDLEGLSVAEAAAVLEVAEGTIKSRCSRGRTRLAGLLSSLAPEGTRNLHSPTVVGSGKPAIPSGAKASDIQAKDPRGGAR